MTSDCGCVYNGANWAMQVESACKRRGVQLTPLRKRVADILSAGSPPLGAYAIMEAVTPRRQARRPADRIPDA